jgi:hypothetical protein
MKAFNVDLFFFEVITKEKRFSFVPMKLFYQYLPYLQKGVFVF